MRSAGIHRTKKGQKLTEPEHRFYPSFNVTVSAADLIGKSIPDEHLHSLGRFQLESSVFLPHGSSSTEHGSKVANSRSEQNPFLAPDPAISSTKTHWGYSEFECFHGLAEAVRRNCDVNDAFGGLEMGLQFISADDYYDDDG